MPGLHAVMLAATLLVASCGGGGGDDAPASPAASLPPRPVQQTDLQIAQLIYAGTPRTPAGFQEDSQPAGLHNVATVHLKNTDIDPSLVAPAPQHELCTDDWTVALDWSETHAQHAMTQYADLVETNDAAHYYEFGRSREGDPDFHMRERVFKCSYLNRATANLRSPEGSAGELHQRPLSGDELRTLAEYLWRFTPYNNFGHAVLKSSGESTASTLSHTLIIATLERAVASGRCDRIDVIAWRHDADATSGALRLDVETLWSFNAREAGGGELCQ